MKDEIMIIRTVKNALVIGQQYELASVFRDAEKRLSKDENPCKSIFIKQPDALPRTLVEETWDDIEVRYFKEFQDGSARGMSYSYWLSNNYYTPKRK